MGWGEGATDSDFFYKESKSKKGTFVRGWGGVDGRTDEQAQTNLPLQLLRS